MSQHVHIEQKTISTARVANTINIPDEIKCRKKGEVVFSTQLFWFCILPLHSTMSFYICNSCYLNSDYLEYSGDGCAARLSTLHSAFDSRPVNTEGAGGGSVYDRLVNQGSRYAHHITKYRVDGQRCCFSVHTSME